MSPLKKDLPQYERDALDRIEAQADAGWQRLSLLRDYPVHVATWAMLVGAINTVKDEQKARGSNTPHFAPMLMNVGRLVPVAIRWAAQHARPAEAPLERRWTGTLAAAVEEASMVARSYHHLELAFQAYHKDRYAAELRAPDLVRFSAAVGTRARQTSSFHKGHRPQRGQFAVVSPSPRPQTPEVQRAFEEALNECRQTGLYSFRHADLRPAWREILPEYRERVNALARRTGNLLLGDYPLEEFNSFYAALLTICAAHDFICFRWGRGRASTRSNRR
jgi:hypothetical protein